MGSRTQILLNGERFDLTIVSSRPRSVQFEIAGRTFEVTSLETVDAAPVKKAAKPQSGVVVTEIPTGGERGKVVAPMPGIVTEVLVQPGEKIGERHPLVRIEAMKMQNTIFSQHGGIVSALFVTAGDEVRDGQALVEIVDS